MSYALKVIKDYPIAFWPLDENSGLVASDISGCGNNGTYHGSPATNILPLVPGGVSGTKITNTAYVSFPTTKDYYGSAVSNGLANKYSSDNDFSLEVWFHHSIESNSLTPLLADSTNDIGIFWENGDIVFKVSDTDLVRWAVSYSQKSMHVVGVYSVNKIALYIDGYLVASKSLGNDFLFTNTSLNLQSGPTLNSGDSFIVDAPAVYRYSLQDKVILIHYNEGNISTNAIHVAYPEKGILFSGSDARNKIQYEYVYGVSRSWSDFLNEDTYFDTVNNWITFNKTETSVSKQLVINDFLMVPQNNGFITSKIEWRNDLGISVESSIDGSTYVSCQNGQAIPQYQKGAFDTSGKLFIRITMSTSDASKYLPRLSFFAVRFYINNDIYADNHGEKITSDSELYAGSLNYPILSRNYSNGVRPEDATGFDVTTQSLINSVEMFFTPITTGANTLFYDPTTGTKYAWNGSGTVSRANISHVYINGVEKTSQTNISNFLVAEEPHHVVLVFTSAVTGALQFNYQTSGGPSNLYKNVTLYNKSLTSSDASTHYELYVGRPSTEIVEPVITMTESTPVYYNNDWVVVQTV